jgi:hypothetical protein
MLWAYGSDVSIPERHHTPQSVLLLVNAAGCRAPVAFCTTGWDYYVEILGILWKPSLWYKYSHLASTEHPGNPELANWARSFPCPCDLQVSACRPEPFAVRSATNHRSAPHSGEPLVVTSGSHFVSCLRNQRGDLSAADATRDGEVSDRTRLQERTRHVQGTRRPIR